MQAGRPPSFVYIGGERCASTWIHACLEEHPQVFVAEPKELDFFTRHLDKGTGWYLSRFTPGDTHAAWGELTPTYLADPDAPRRLAEIAPGCRLLCSFRNPIDRAFSYYQLRRDAPPLAGLSLEDIIEQDAGGIVSNGLYADHLERWFEHFPPEDTCIVMYDDLLRDDARVIREVYSHLRIDPEFRPSWIGKTKNTAVFPKAQDMLRRAGLGPAMRLARKTPIHDLARRLARMQRRAQGGRRVIPPEVERRLAETYREPNDRLANLVGVDLSHWTPPAYRGASG